MTPKAVGYWFEEDSGSMHRESNRWALVRFEDGIVLEYEGGDMTRDALPLIHGTDAERAAAAPAYNKAARKLVRAALLPKYGEELCEEIMRGHIPAGMATRAIRGAIEDWLRRNEMV